LELKYDSASPEIHSISCWKAFIIKHKYLLNTSMFAHDLQLSSHNFLHVVYA